MLLGGSVSGRLINRRTNRDGFWANSIGFRDTMNLEVTRNLLARDLQASDPADLLIHVFEAVVELLSIEGNDFTWSRWSHADEALAEVRSILARMKNGDLPERTELAVLFAPTGPIQEVSLSSGWADVFEKVSERFDHAAQPLWGKG